MTQAMTPTKIVRKIVYKTIATKPALMSKQYDDIDVDNLSFRRARLHPEVCVVVLLGGLGNVEWVEAKLGVHHRGVLVEGRRGWKGRPLEGKKRVKGFMLGFDNDSFN